MRLITDILRDIRKGRVVDEASVRLATLVRTCTELGKSGSLTLKLTVSPQAGDKGVVTITPALSCSMPEASIPNAIFYAGEDGTLTREDPNQGDLIRDAAKLSGGVRDVGVV